MLLLPVYLIHQVPPLQPPIVVGICFKGVPSLSRITISAASPIRSSSSTRIETVPSELGGLGFVRDVFGSPALFRISTFMPEVVPVTVIVQRSPLHATFSREIG